MHGTHADTMYRSLLVPVEFQGAKNLRYQQFFLAKDSFQTTIGTIAEVLDQKYASFIDPRSSFSDRGLSHRTFDQVIDTKIWLVVGPRSLVLGNQRLLVLN